MPAPHYVKDLLCYFENAPLSVKVLRHTDRHTSRAACSQLKIFLLYKPIAIDFLKV